MTGGAAGLVVDGLIERGSFSLRLRAAVEPGEVVAVLGPNGAGKSTLLRALAGLVELKDGSIRLDGAVLDDAATDTWVPPEQRPVGIVFQDYRLFPHLDVLDNIAFAPRSTGASRAASRATAREWVGRLGLTDLAQHRPGQLSGGQAQRVALARSLAADPRLLLLDEPLAALDARTRLDVRTALRAHIDAMVIADRIIVIEQGRVVQEGTPAQVARHPATDYVARLVGLNLYAGTRDTASAVVNLDGGGTLTVSPTPGTDAEARRLLVALPPAAVSLFTTPVENTSARNVWTGAVTGIELLGDRVRVEVTGAPSCLVDITPAALADLGLERGTRVWLTAKATETIAYPA